MMNEWGEFVDNVPSNGYASPAAQHLIHVLMDLLATGNVTDRQVLEAGRRQ